MNASYENIIYKRFAGKAKDINRSAFPAEKKQDIKE
jgi:hypothetical protein